MKQEIYKAFAYPFLNRVDSETWHNNAIRALHFIELSDKFKLLEFICRVADGNKIESDRLKSRIGNLDLMTPTLLGAGWTKSGKGARAIYKSLQMLPIVGSIPEFPQSGKEKPRQWGINSVGFNRRGLDSPGMEAVAQTLDSLGVDYKYGVSLVKNNDNPYNQTPEILARIARNFPKAGIIEINISCPNVKDSGSHDSKVIEDTCLAVKGETRAEVLLKLSPDLDDREFEELMDIALRTGCSGIVIANTTTNQDIKRRYGFEGQIGGISGADPDYINRCKTLTERAYEDFGDRLIIVASGGIDSGTALKRIKLGASAVEFVTAMRGEGPWVARRTNRLFDQYMRRNGIADISKLVGIETRRGARN